MRVHPAAERPTAALLAGAFLLAVTAALFTLVAPLTAALLTLALWGSQASFFLPTDLELREEGLSVRTGCWRQVHPWKRFRRVVPDRHGLLLSPFTRRHGLEGFRGLFLPLTGAQSRTLRPQLEARL